MICVDHASEQFKQEDYPHSILPLPHPTPASIPSALIPFPSYPSSPLSPHDARPHSFCRRSCPLHIPIVSTSPPHWILSGNPRFQLACPHHRLLLLAVLDGCQL